MRRFALAVRSGKGSAVARRPASALKQPAPMFPRWRRAWHWTNAVLFLVLGATGFSMHLAGTRLPLIPFRQAVVAHNVAAALILAAYAGYLVALAWTGEWRQYVPRLRGLAGGVAVQVRYYLHGVFRGEHHPFSATPARRFNPLQQVVYAVHLFLLFPLLAITGARMLFAGPARATNIWPAAAAHTLLAYGFVAFLTGHLYLALTASEPHTGVRAMLLGDPPPAAPGAGEGATHG